MERTSSIIPLDYAPAPWPWWKWIRRGAGFVFVFTLGFLAWQFGPWAWKQAQIRYWQRQCMSFTLSPDQVVMEQEPAAAAKLLAEDSRLRSGVHTDAAGKVHSTAYSLPRPLTELFSLILPNSANRMNQMPPVIFMHRMVQPDGRPRLVVLVYFGRLTHQMAGFDPNFEVLSYVITPATVFRAPTVQHTNSGMLPSNQQKTPIDRHMRIYAGQIDPNDPSHLTIRYRAWGQEDVMDGWLDNNGIVTIKPRNWPTPRAPGN